MHLCQSQLGWFVERSCGDAALGTEITVLAKHASKFARRSVMTMAYPLDDFFHRSAAYDRGPNLARNMCSTTLTKPRPHYDGLTSDSPFIATTLMPASLECRVGIHQRDDGKSSHAP
jgi:hypothetical protein